MKQKVLVVDLDETLYAINTFHYFIKFIFFHGLKEMNFVLLCYISYVCSLRLTGMVSHATMKFLIIKRIERENLNYSEFIQDIKKHRRELTLDKSNFKLKILATGAPFCYASLIAKEEGFDKCVATQYPHKIDEPIENYENIRTVKLKNVFKLLREVNYDGIDVLITDHLDDLPLMQVAKTTIIVNAAPEMKEKLHTLVEKNNIEFIDY